MGAGDSLGVEPPVAAGGKAEGQLFVLVVIFSHINVIAVTAYIVEGNAGDFHLFPPGGAFSADIAAFDQFLADLDQIFLLLRDVQGGADGFQVLHLRLRLQREIRKRFEGTL